MDLGDKVTCNPDGKVRGCKVIDKQNSEVKIKWYPGPMTKWLPKDKVTLSEEWNRQKQN